MAVRALIPGTYISRWAPCVRTQGSGRDSSRQDRKAPEKRLPRTAQPRFDNVVRQGPRRHRLSLPAAPLRGGEGGIGGLRPPFLSNADAQRRLRRSAVGGATAMPFAMSFRNSVNAEPPHAPSTTLRAVPLPRTASGGG